MKSSPQFDLASLLAGLNPRLNEGQYIFATFDPSDVWPSAAAIAMIREKEGVSVVLPQEFAVQNDLEYDQLFSWITLEIHSALEAVGASCKILTDQ